MPQITAQEIPLIAISNQQLNVTLGRQNCTITVYQRGDRLYLDLSVATQPIRAGCLCIPYAPLIVGDADFSGQLRIVDTLSPVNAQTTPHYSGLGERYKLYYLPPESEAVIQDARYTAN